MGVSSRGPFLRSRISRPRGLRSNSGIYLPPEVPLVADINRRANEATRLLADSALGRRPRASCSANSLRFRATLDRGETVTTGVPLLMEATTVGESLGGRQWIGRPSGSRGGVVVAAGPVPSRITTTLIF